VNINVRCFIHVCACHDEYTEPEGLSLNSHTAEQTTLVSSLQHDPSTEFEIKSTVRCDAIWYDTKYL